MTTELTNISFTDTINAGGMHMIEAVLAGLAISVGTIAGVTACKIKISGLNENLIESHKKCAKVALIASGIFILMTCLAHQHSLLIYGHENLIGNLFFIAGSSAIFQISGAAKAILEKLVSPNNVGDVRDGA